MQISYTCTSESEHFQLIWFTDFRLFGWYTCAQRKYLYYEKIMKLYFILFTAIHLKAVEFYEHFKFINQFFHEIKIKLIAIQKPIKF